MADDEKTPQLTVLPGTDRGITLNPRAASGPPPSDEIEATVVLERRAEVPDSAFSEHLSREDFAERYGADPAAVDEAVSTFEGLGLRVVSVDAGTRRIRVAGAVSAMNRAFGTRLEWRSSDDEHGTSANHWSRSGSLSVPSNLAGSVTAVLGLDDRPQARANVRLAMPNAAATSYTPVELGVVYDFPEGTDGSGRTVAIIELGGGFVDADLDAYFADLDVNRPTVTAVGVDGGANSPGDASGADGEVMLDIEVVGALAPEADIVVYFAPNTDAGFVDAVAAAAHADPTPDAISISWGQYEDAWTEQARKSFDDALVDAAALGVTVTVAAGDDGSTDRAGDDKVHVDFPAASPHALACGGTRLEANGSTGEVSSEVVWNNGSGNGATGGGVSRFFALPSWQESLGVPEVDGKTGRGVPDVAAVADPETGYRIRVDGKDEVIGGTSAVSPLWAALVARINQSTGARVGLAQPALYASVSKGEVAEGFRDVTKGDNGAYEAAAGWDPCTGLGVPDGDALLARLG